ncbi:MAG: histidinol-phosphate transaminase [Rikenellaceae bacterium]
MKKDILRLVRPNILALEPYSTARDEYEGGEIDVWLDANENPFDNGVNRYPDPHQLSLKAQLSQIKGVSPKNIFIGNGSDEAIDLAFRVFARPGVDNAVSIAPTYGMYKVAAATNDIEVREVQLGENFALPVEELLAAADENTKLMWICSPNNPTGNMFPVEQIVDIIERFNGIVVVDEAYIDFADSDGFLPKLANYENLIVLQTLSKAWAMAGLRFGLAFASEQIISLMNMVKYPYNINVLTQAKVAEMLTKGITGQVEEIVAQRTRVIEELAKIPLIERIFDTQANFVLVRTAAANDLYDKLVDGGVIVRNRSRVKGCENTLRITIGTATENDRMLDIINNYK